MSDNAALKAKQEAGFVHVSDSGKTKGGKDKDKEHISAPAGVTFKGKAKSKVAGNKAKVKKAIKEKAAKKKEEKKKDKKKSVPPYRPKQEEKKSTPNPTPKQQPTPKPQPTPDPLSKKESGIFSEFGEHDRTIGQNKIPPLTFDPKTGQPIQSSGKPLEPISGNNSSTNANKEKSKSSEHKTFGF